MDLTQIKLCDGGTEQLKTLVNHISECADCQRELLLTVKGFPFAAMLFGSKPEETLKRLKGTLNNGKDNKN